MSRFKIVEAAIGLTAGQNIPFVRPDVVGASDANIQSAFDITRGFTNITAKTVSRSGLASVSVDSTAQAKIAGAKWSDNKSYGIIVVDDVSQSKVRRYMLGLYVDRDAIINGVYRALKQAE